MANPLKILQETFLYNSMLARALVQLVPQENRGSIRIWLDKLHEMGSSLEEWTVRNDYMWFLLLVLQNGKIVAPFDKPPVLSTLQPLEEVLQPKIYEEVLNSTTENFSWMERLEENEKASESLKLKRKELRACKPDEFLENQPCPRDGVVCYIAAFSD